MNTIDTTTTQAVAAITVPTNMTARELRIESGRLFHQASNGNDYLREYRAAKARAYRAEAMRLEAVQS